MQPGVKSIVRLGISGLLVATTCAAAAGQDPPGKDKARHTNRLAKETSPYLLLHAHNPVDWYPWGPEAFAKAKAEDKPIFLSVGYSSCYWCHVMERESFMDAEIAKALNAGFVCIKVDREERPDVDQIYMTALQAMGPGGWPMSMFLMPDGRPFVGGTYFPPRDRDGSAGFLTVVTEVARAWGKDRAAIDKTADAVTEALRGRLKAAEGERRGIPPRPAVTQGEAQLAEQFDQEYGGFGFNPVNPKRPKFPEPVNLEFLLEQHRRGATKAGETGAIEMVTVTLENMARGGIRDQLGGGYHRYSTDRFWVIPHFEKMLYDNAQLASVQLAAFEITDDSRWRLEAEAIFGFVESKMTSPEGAFYSALDAETNGEEGAYYLWTRDEVKTALGDGADVATFALLYGLAGKANAEDDHYVLREPHRRSVLAAELHITPEELETRLAPLRKKLLGVREKRPSPLLDDKVLCSWNGLMIAAYADGYRVLKNDRYKLAAEKAATFVLEKLRTRDGRLRRTYRQGNAKLAAYVEDYAFLAHGLLRLHRATGEARWAREAQALVDRMITDFEDKENGGFYFTAGDHEQLLARAKDPFDNALPGGNSMAILDLIELYRITRQTAYLDRAGKALSAFGSAMVRVPVALPMMLIGLGRYLDERPESASKDFMAQAKPEQPRDLMVTASASTAGDSPDELAPGHEFGVTVKVAIKPGWHIYAHPTGVADLSPTRLDVHPESRNLVTIGKIDYPKGEQKVLASSGKEKVALYEGEVGIKASCTLADEAKAGKVVLKFRLTHQACNDQLCQAPFALEIPLTVTIAAKK
jgi:uncharacterized protein YyaL (SSP411 family)